MRAATSMKDLRLRSDIRNILSNKKQQEYSLNREYNQFETTYGKDFKDIKITLSNDFSPDRQ
jgi:hypothetical protein